MRTSIKNKWVFAAAKVSVSATILWFVARETDVSTAARQIETISWGWVVLAFALFVFQVLLNSVRWCLLVRLDDGQLRLRDAFRMYLEAGFFSQALPTALGGDVVRVYGASKLGHRLSQAIHGVLLDRLAGAIGLVLLMVAGLIPFFAMVANPTARVGFAMIPSVAVLALAVLLLLGFLGEKLRLRFGQWLVRFAELFQRMLRPRTALPALGLAVMGHMAIVSGAWLLAKSLGIGASWLSCFTIVPAAILISMLPISIAGWGVREGAMATGFAFIGVGGESGLLLSLGVGLILLAVGLLGGLVWLLDGMQPLPARTP